MIEKLLETRKRIKSKKPEFLIQDFHKRKELPRKWRKPKGLHSKMRLRKKGHPKNVEIGYSSPKLVRNLDRRGMQRILVSNPKEISSLDKEKQSILIRHGVGARMRIEILRIAGEKGIRVINSSIEKENKKTEKRKTDKSARMTAAKKTETPVTKEKKPTKEETTIEEKAEEEKKEKESILTKREI